MRFSHTFRTTALSILGACASVGGTVLLLSSPAQAENLRLADNHTGGTTTNGDMMTPAANQTTDAMTIVEVASSNDSFDTLVQAVQAANLTGTLSGEGPYTVFAPTDEAFSQLPDGALDFLLLPENRDLLTKVLTYHVVPGSVMAKQLSTGGISALGGGIAIRVSDAGVVVNNGSVVNADIQASNGVIHVVNRVLIPEAVQQQLATQLGVSSIY